MKKEDEDCAEGSRTERKLRRESYGQRINEESASFNRKAAAAAA